MCKHLALVWIASVFQIHVEVEMGSDSIVWLAKHWNRNQTNYGPLAASAFVLVLLNSFPLHWNTIGRAPARCWTRCRCCALCAAAASCGRSGRCNGPRPNECFRLAPFFGPVYQSRTGRPGPTTLPGASTFSVLLSILSSVLCQRIWYRFFFREKKTYTDFHSKNFQKFISSDTSIIREILILSFPSSFRTLHRGKSKIYKELLTMRTEHFMSCVANLEQRDWNAG